MGDASAGDPRDLLAALEEKLRRLEHELRGTADEAGLTDEPATTSPGRGGSDPGAAAAAPVAPGQPPPASEAAAVAAPHGSGGHVPSAPPPADAEPAARPALDDSALLAAARAECDELRARLDGLSGATDELRVLARTVAAQHAGALLRLQRAAAAARRAADAAESPGTGLVPDAVLVEAAPFADPGALDAFRAAVAAAPGARDVYLRSFEGGRAVLEVRLGGA